MRIELDQLRTLLISFHILSMKSVKHSIAVSLATALTTLSVAPAAFAFGGFQGADIPEEAHVEMKACHDSVLANYGIEVPTETDAETTGRRFGRRGHFNGATSNLTVEQRAAIKEEEKACTTDVAAKYNLEMPDRSAFKGRNGRRGHRGFRGGFGEGMQDLSDADRNTIESLMQQIRDLMQKYQTSN
jgi:hypothetical protein